MVLVVAVARGLCVAILCSVLLEPVVVEVVVPMPTQKMVVVVERAEARQEAREQLEPVVVATEAVVEPPLRVVQVEQAQRERMVRLVRLTAHTSVEMAERL
jgi:hypothetical protein